MRVITGTAKGRKLLSPEGLETRPTSEMVKEAVFSIIQFELEGANVLDLFAGSGQMGIEALSRGAKYCVFVDNAKASQAAIRDNLAHAGLAGNARLVGTDAVSFLQGGSGSFHIAFLDPPYRKGLMERTLPLVAAVMDPVGAILCETDRKEELPETAGAFVRHREYRYGKTKVTLYRRPADADVE